MLRMGVQPSLFLLQLLRDAETCVKLEDAADGEGDDPFLPVERPPMVLLHTHHYQCKDEATAGEKLLAAEANECDVAPKILRLHLHQREQKRADAKGVHPHFRIHYIYSCTGEHQQCPDAETSILKRSQLFHSAFSKTNTSSPSRFMR